MRRLGRIFLVFLALIGSVTLMGIGATVWFAAQHAGPEPLAERVVLTVDLDRGIAEHEPGGPFGRFKLGGRYPLRDVVDALDRAAADERVAGLLVRASDARIGMARAQELREAVAAFRASGKPAVVFSESIGGSGNGTIGYYLASAFEEIWLQPSGDVAITGFSIESPFLKGLLDELEIEPQFGARHEFKTAIEVFTETGFSAPNRQSLEALLTSFSGQFVEAVAKERGIAAEQVRHLVDTSPLMAEEALGHKLVDRLGYWDEAEAKLKGADGELLDVQDYLARVGRPHQSGAKIALIYGVGGITSSDEQGTPLGGEENLSAAAISEALRDAAEDEAVKAILLRIDSPGGSYVASDTVWRSVHTARKAGKPVVVSMGSTAASGGYFIAMAADRIVANPATITGSIGVFGGKMVLKDFWKKLGVSWDQVNVGANAGMWSANEPFPDPAWRRFQQQLDRIYADFTGKVGEARSLDAAALDKVARGRIFSGADAKAVGLVDELGGFATALRVTREAAGLKPADPVELAVFPERKGTLEQLAEALQTGKLPQVAAMAEGLRTLARIGAVLDPVLSRMEASDAQQGELRLPPGVTTSDW